MADLTDEEKAKAVIGNVEEETPAETPEPETPSTEEEQENQEVEEQPEEEAPAETSTEEPETPQSTFTKQFPNLKGDTPEDYVKELETAYQNSSNEALRLKKIADDSAKLVDEAKAIIAGNQQPATQTPATPTTPSMLQIDSLPEIQYAKAQMQKDMIGAFDEFTKEYPMARETDAFNRFTAASDGVALAFKAGTGRDPTYPELYKEIANILGWQPVTPAKDQAIKDATSSSQTGGGSTLPPAQRPKVTEKEVDVYMKMMSNKPDLTRADAIKALSEVK